MQNLRTFLNIKLYIIACPCIFAVNAFDTFQLLPQNLKHRVIPFQKYRYNFVFKVCEHIFLISRWPRLDKFIQKCERRSR